MLNVATLKVGERVVLKGGDRAEVVENPEDGMWIAVRRLGAGDARGTDAPETAEGELVHADQVVRRA